MTQQHPPQLPPNRERTKDQKKKEWLGMIFSLIPNTSGLSYPYKRGDYYDTHFKLIFFSFRLGSNTLKFYSI